MTDTSGPRQASDESDVDLLVDGELDDQQRRELLLRLEQEPDGWRCCALAFLEAQCLGQQLGAWVRQEVGAPKTPTSHETTIANQSRRGHGWMRGHLGALLAAAASFLVAFTLGLVLSNAWDSSGGNLSGGGQIVKIEQDVGQDGISPDREIAVDGATESDVSDDDADVELDDPWETLTLVVGSAEPDGERRISLPVRLAADVPDDWLSSQPPAVSAEVVRALEELGHKVKQRRRLWPFELEDGRRVIVPVDQMEFRRVDYGPYQ